VAPGTIATKACNGAISTRAEMGQNADVAAESDGVSPASFLARVPPPVVSFPIQPANMEDVAHVGSLSRNTNER